MNDRKSAQRLKERVREQLTSVGELVSNEAFALNAQWPDAVLKLSLSERKDRVRSGAETVLLKDESSKEGVRGFVRAVLRVPLELEPEHAHEAQVYGVFVEVDRANYLLLQSAFREKRAVEAQGILATRLPLLHEAFQSGVSVFEDGGEKRARIIKAESDLLNHGPQIGP